jgi:hypothetical protein
MVFFGYSTRPLAHDQVFFLFFFLVGFGSILWDRWSGDHPQEDLDKFGYRLERKVEKEEEEESGKKFN